MGSLILMPSVASFRFPFSLDGLNISAIFLSGYDSGHRLVMTTVTHSHAAIVVRRNPRSITAKATGLGYNADRQSRGECGEAPGL